MRQRPRADRHARGPRSGPSREEELLDFDFDKLPEESEAKTASSSDEEILDLVDVIEKGKNVANSGSDEIVKLLDNDKSDEDMVELKGSETSKELELALEDEILQSLESDLDDIKRDFIDRFRKILSEE